MIIKIGNRKSAIENQMWGCSSVGRAVALQAIGREFESPQLHQPSIGARAAFGPPDHRSLITGHCSGAIAQLGERVLCKHEVVGSIPSGSTRRPVARSARGKSETEFAETHGVLACRLSLRENLSGRPVEALLLLACIPASGAADRGAPDEFEANWSLRQ